MFVALCQTYLVYSVMFVSSDLNQDSTVIYHFQHHVTPRIPSFSHLVVVSKQISGMCWYMASKSRPHSVTCFTFPAHAFWLDADKSP